MTYYVTQHYDSFHSSYVKYNLIFTNLTYFVNAITFSTMLDVNL